MNYGKKIMIENTTRFYTAITIIAILILMIGAGLGFASGIALASHDTEETYESPNQSTTEPLTMTETTPTNVYYDCPLSEHLQDYIRTLCEENGVPMPVVIAQIKVESNYGADVVSPTNDYGLMQINRVNHAWLSEKYLVTDFLDPYQNVFCGIKILSEYYNRFDDLDKALMAYNLGEAGARKLWNNGIYSTSYVKKIRTAMDELQRKEDEGK